MNIETDLVKKKEFSTSINSGIQKHSQEYKVLAILRYLYPQKFSTMINGEAPDLQDNENGVGIEVVSAAQENDMRASRAFSELHQTKGGDNEKSEERIRASGYKFVPVQGKKVGISTTGTSDSEKVLVQKIVLKKAGKIQQYKKNFRKVGLAILFSETPTSYAEDHCLEFHYQKASPWLPSGLSIITSANFRYCSLVQNIISRFFFLPMLPAFLQGFSRRL